MYSSNDREGGATDINLKKHEIGVSPTLFVQRQVYVINSELRIRIEVKEIFAVVK